MLVMPSSSDVPSWYAVHKRALKAKEKSYIDPDTGYFVFTELAHLERGVCCGSRCRHCPFNHVNCRTSPSKT
ncbi:hypothetical protein EG68_03538 [Paragonimus skrjabini miyazakii]|uniref:Uncharacterized protein n=1 Tax=Paragonimus skrjabini miyazakii TaxID=59628 RepID=A0A8S9YUX2_9TREM|nr:hypothetical protein EG68_03538 [Paragonimus skrjabini miyazakii]